MIFMSFMFLLFTATVNPAQSQAISIKDNSAILDCEGGEDGKVKWMKDKTEIENQKNQTYEVKAEQEKVEGVFSCEYTNTGSNEIKHVFYLRVKVCVNCYELNGVLAWGVILGDLMVTGGVILIVYLFATKNSDGTQKKASNSRSLNPPRPPNPDYEALDPKMRSNAVYAGLNK